ncbi:MAG TPA: T9SS type A sorting domain-containing protein [Chitinophagaceae bacterium]|nr:T9SS type A sorting domain-containing protein [Chitinophagaceae bacterium]
MKLTYTLLIFACIPFLAQSQLMPSIQWAKAYGGTQQDYAYDILQTTDSGYVIAGISTSLDGNVTGHHGTSDWADCWIVRTDKTGIIKWEKSIGGNGDDWASQVKETPDKGFIIAGYSGYGNVNTGDISSNHGGYDVLVVKLDSAGTIQWSKSIGGSDDEQANAIQVTKDSGYIIAGYTFSNDGDVSGHHSGNAYDCWVVKLNRNGAIQWQKCLGGTDEDLARDVQLVGDSGYVITGGSSSVNGDVSGNKGGSDFWVVRLDTAGNIKWQKCLGGSNVDAANSIKTTKDGGYIVAGYTYSVDGDVTDPVLDPTYSDIWIVKLDSSGSLLWQKRLGGGGNDVATSVQTYSDTSYVVGGYTSSHDGDVTVTHGGTDYWMLKLDTTGNLLWQKTFGGANDDVANSLVVTSDSGYIMAGRSASNDGDVSGNHGNNDFWVIKLSKDEEDGTLPVGLKYLTGQIKGSSALLQWQTATELNSSYFNIQRSTNGLSFSNAGKVAAAGYSNAPVNYFYADDLSTVNIPSQVVYYRLEEVDKDNKKQYSGIISLKFASFDNKPVISPNPVKNSMTLHLNGAANNSKAQIVIFNMLGQKMQQVSQVANKDIIINTSRFLPGTYIVSIQLNGKLLQQKFIKQ